MLFKELAIFTRLYVYISDRKSVAEEVFGKFSCHFKKKDKIYINININIKHIAKYCVVFFTHSFICKRSFPCTYDAEKYFFCRHVLFVCA